MLDQLMEQFRLALPEGASIIDLFSGTSSVSRAARVAGYRVHANDHLPLCEMWAKARLLASDPVTFDGLTGIATGSHPNRYEAVITELNAVEPTAGWLTEHYSPESLAVDGVERRYLTTDNAKRADSMRDRIEDWRPDLTDEEHALLLASLISGVTSVSNVAGTFGCYLKSWKPRALGALRLQTIPLIKTNPEGHVVTSHDALTAVEESSADAIYADPPYSKRQYGAYYHLLNSLVLNTKPPVTGKTGLPHWQEWSSDWCYAKRAATALELVAAKAVCEWFFMSYSSDGHMSNDTIVDVLSSFGDLNVVEWQNRRYRSSRLLHTSDTVTERLYVLKKC